MLKDEPAFEWNELKHLENQRKHGVSFEEAQYAFLDHNQIIVRDDDHSQSEQRYYCFGLGKNKTRVLTVRFTYRNGKIRIFGSGYWRRGKQIYEKEI